MTYCGEQSGIYKIVLYENIDIAVIRDSSGLIESIVNNGNVLEFNECENMLLNYTDRQQSGKNDVILHTHSAIFSLFGFSSAYEQLDNLASIFGFIPVFYFRNDTIKTVLAPIFFEESNYNEGNTQVYPLNLSNQNPTFELLRDFAATPVIWVLEDGLWGGSNTVWTADGIWNTV